MTDTSGTTATTEIHKGLAGVVADVTAISKVNPETNSLLYRGYPVQELAATQPFEAVAWLLWKGELPTTAELAELRATERAHRALADDVRSAIDLLPRDVHPMDEVRTAVSVIGAREAAGDSVLDAAGNPEENLARSVRLFAALPAVVAYGQRRRHGQGIVAPRDDLDYAANFLWMTFATEAEPAVVDAFAALKGPLHGGANEAVMHTLAEIGSAQNVGAWLDDALASKKKIMGFGHRVYKHGDSRVPTMKAALDTLVEHYDRPDLAELANT